MRFFCCTLLFVLLLNCNNSDVNKTTLIHYTPKNTSIILRTNNIEALKSSINNSDFFKNLSNATAYQNLEDKLGHLSLLKPSGDVLICFTKDQNDSLHYTVITKNSAELFVTDSLKNFTSETLSYNKKTVVKSTLNNHTFYSTKIDSIFIASSSQAILEAAYNKAPLDPDLEKIYNTTTTDKTVSIIAKTGNNFIKSFFLEGLLPFKTFTTYTAIDVDINQNQLYMNGITKGLDSLRTVTIFNNTIPQENKVQHVTPQSSDGFLSFTFNHFENLETNLKRFSTKDSTTTTTSLFDNVIEVGVIYEGEKRAIVLNSIDIISTKEELLGEQNVFETFRETEIFSFSQPYLFFKTFTPLITFKDANKYCVLDNYFVFSDNVDMLRNVITNYHNQSTWSEQYYFKDIKDQLNDASSLMLVGNANLLKSILETNLGAPLSSSLSNYNASAIQFIYDNDFAHVNAIIKQTKAKRNSNTISEELNITLDTDLLNTPQFVTNHITKEKEIVVQDLNNNLYLISNKGKILWKKPLEGPILGTIEQIDIYKNGRLQLVFATPHRVYVVDRNGKDVGPFPAKFNDKITQPLSVFDYDKNKNYRLLVTQGKNILMYDVNAKLVNGFTFKSANDNISHQPQHIRINNRDYILLKTSSKLYILDRTGRTRITPKTASTFSNQPVFYYNDKIITTNIQGDLISIDTQGNTSITNQNLNENHHIDASRKSLITLSENKLTIKGKTIELDFGAYTAPKLFYIQDKIYVAVTDVQAHKVYLFDSQGEIIPHFPVYGNSLMALDIIDKSNALGFVVKGEDNSIILYNIL